MSNELFDINSVSMDSPRLAWKKKHSVETEKLERAGDEDDNGDTIPQWVCRIKKLANGARYFPNQIAGGDTEDEALAEYAAKNSIPLWNEEASQTPSDHEHL